MRLWMAMLLCSTLAAAPPPPLALEEVRREGDLLKRFDKALRLAEARLNDAWKLVREEGPRTQLEAAIAEVVGGAGLALESLRATGRRPGRLSGRYKRGELRTRAFEKGLRELGLAVGFEERERVEQARQRMAEIHEQFLAGVMGGE